MAKQLSLVGLAVVASLAMVACSGSDGDSAPNVVRADQAEPRDSGASDPSDAPTSDPAPAEGVCGLLTKEEVEAELGREVEEGVEDSFDNGEVVRCSWTVTMPPPRPELSDSLNARVLIVPLTDTDRAELDVLAQHPESIVVEGLGDLAVIRHSVLPGPMYVVLNDDEYLEVDIANFSTPVDFPNEERIAEILTAFATLAVSRI